MASDDAAWVTFDADKYLNDLIWGYVIDAIAKVELRAQMSDHLADTPNLAKPWCPTCQPDRDQMAEILEVSYCGIHQINFTAGSADALVPPPKNYSWNYAGDVDPETQRAWAEFIRDNGWRN
jgi:hypothetical protein